MTRTNGLLAGLLVLSVAGVAGGVGYITQQNIATYESELASAVADARAELRPQGIDVSVQTVSTSMLGMKPVTTAIPRVVMAAAQAAPTKNLLPFTAPMAFLMGVCGSQRYSQTPTRLVRSGTMEVWSAGEASTTAAIVPTQPASS